MGDFEAAKIVHENHLLLDQPLLRLPFELLRKNFRSAHWTVEKEATHVKTLLKEAATASLNGQSSPEDTLKNIDAMLLKMRGLKRKLSSYAAEEARLYKQMDARVAHLSELSEMHTVDDVRYQEWSRQRLDRLLVDYFLRHGYSASAIAMADQKGMHDLVDIETFMAMNKIRKCLEGGSVTEALAWCNENKKELRKTDSNLEFMLRYQQYIELVRSQTTDKLVEAIAHAKKYLIPYKDTYPREVHQAAGLLAFPPDRVGGASPPSSSATYSPYAALYSPERWTSLAALFVRTHNSLLALPAAPLLHVALSAGLSALKTPACHHSGPAAGAKGGGGSGSSGSSSGGGVCPVCSTELNELARAVPYAHHSKSHVDPDLLLLPNGRVYGRARLDEYAAKQGLPPETVKDLVTGDVFPAEVLKKVFIT